MQIASTNVNIKRRNDLQLAASGAREEAANTAGFTLIGVLFRQGSRQYVSTAFPIRQVLASLRVDAVAKRGSVSEVLSATNRPVMPDHVAAIADYLVENVGGKYILPPMTLNVQQTISVYEPDYESELKPVYLVIPMTAKLSVTDGGHRTMGIIRALEKLSDEKRDQFGQDAVSVMITLESNPEQVHQDFADCSKTKALPPSQLAAYDRRNPANGLVLDLIRDCPLFKDKIDSTSKTLSKNSNHIFLTNQVRQLVKELLVGDYGLADDAFEAKAKDILGSSDTEAYRAERTRFTDYINKVTDTIPVLKEIAATPTTGIERNQLKDCRDKGYICLTATGLVILGRIGHELFKKKNAAWNQVVDRFAEIDWQRDAAIWRGNIVRDGKMSTQRAWVKVAAEKVRRAVGLEADLRLNVDGHDSPAFTETASSAASGDAVEEPHVA
jgi:DNA sulfur modification protein DndB